MNLRSALTAALALNAALAAAVVFLLLRQPAAPPTPPAAPTNPAPAATPAAPAPPPPTPPVATTSFDWRMVESEDYKKYIANLRSIGCPEETIHDIITADVGKLFEARRKELRNGQPKFQFWKAGNPMAGLVNPDLLLKDQELAKERRALLVDLLGSAPEETPGMAMARFNPLESLLDFLPSAKQAKVVELMEKQQAKMMKLIGGGGGLDADDMKRMRDFQRDSDRELAAILTPAELEDYQLRMSQTAMTMRFGLGAFEPTEQEFRDIFKLRKTFDDEHSQFVDGTDQAAMQKRMEAERDMNESIQKVLGDARFAEYQRSQDFNFQQLSKLAERQGLPRDTAIKAYDMSRTAQDEVSRVQLDPKLTQDQRNSALAGIRSETERSLRQVLGDQAFDSFRKQPTAFWLRGDAPGGQTTVPTITIGAP